VPKSASNDRWGPPRNHLDVDSTMPGEAKGRPHSLSQTASPPTGSAIPIPMIPPIKVPTRGSEEPTGLFSIDGTGLR